ncbi:MAG: hypothetical protein PHX93_05745 [Candidatus Peribacteraceae bacterium]|nr:hypothetical protein [Candidatus Peribacteraceae bacterium]
MTRTPQKVLEWDEFTYVDGDACIGSDWAAPCTIILGRGKDIRPAYLGHFLTLATHNGMINLQILKMLAEAQRSFGDQLRLRVFGNSFFPHKREHLRPAQMRARKIFEEMLTACGIPADICWAPDNVLTHVTFDAQTGKESVEIREYVPPKSDAAL